MTVLPALLLAAAAHAAPGRATTIPALAAHVLETRPLAPAAPAGMMETALGLPAGLRTASLIWAADEATDGQAHLFIVLRRGRGKGAQTYGVVLGTIREEPRRTLRHYLLTTPDGTPVRAAVAFNELDASGKTLPDGESVSPLPLAHPDFTAWLAHEREFYFEWRHRKGVSPDGAPSR